MRYRLRTLLIILVLAPPALAWYGWPALQRLMTPLTPIVNPPPPPSVLDDYVPFPNGYPSPPPGGGDLALPPLAEPPSPPPLAEPPSP